MKKSKKNLDLLEDENLGQKLVKKGFWLYLFSYLIAPAGYLVRLLISNSPEVSVADVGILYSIIGLVNFLNVYNDLWLTESLQYFLPKFWIRKEYNHIKTAIWLSLWAQLLTSIIIIGGLRCGADWLASNYFHNESAAIILKYFCRYFLGINLFQTLQSIFIAFQKTFDYQLVEFIKIWATVWFTAFFIFTGHGTIVNFSLNRIFWLGIGLVVAGLLYWRKYRSDLMQGKFQRDTAMLKPYTQYALWAFIWANVGNLFGQIIQQMVIYLLGAEAAGYYANFLSLFYVGSVIIWPIIWLIFPLVSELAEKDNKGKIWFLFSLFYTYFSVLTISISVLFVVFSLDISLIFFGSKYSISGYLLSRWSLFLPFHILVNFNFSVLAGMGKIVERVSIIALSSLITLVITYFLIKFYGIQWSAISFWISYLLLRIISLIKIRRINKFNPQRSFIIKNTIITILLWIGIYFAKKTFVQSSDNKLISFLFLSGSCTIYYAILSVINRSHLKEIIPTFSKMRYS